MKDDRQYVPIGGVRGLAIIWVSLVYRYVLLLGWPFKHRPKIGYSLVWDGYLMVELFFFLSGYFSYVKYHDMISSGDITFGHYLGDKVKKLFPLMILTALITTIIQLIGKICIDDYGFSNTISLSGIILSCLGLQSGYFNDGGIYANPTEWYICILMIDYAIFYGICKLRNSTIRRFLLVIWAVLGCAIMLKPYDHIGGFVSNGRGYFGFGYGSIFASFYDVRKEKNRKNRVWASMVGITGIAVLWTLYPEYIGDKNIVFVILICPMVFILAVGSKLLRKIFGSKLLLLLGQWSYHIYLWSFPVDIAIKIVLRYIEKTELIQTVYVWLISGALILLVSYVSCKWIEEPTRKMFVSIKKAFE